MTSNTSYPLEGGCDCKRIRYRMETAPPHRALLPLPLVSAGNGHGVRPERNDRGRARHRSAGGARAHRHAFPERPRAEDRALPGCRIAVWSNYAGAGPILRFVRVGTLDTPRCPAAAHSHLHQLEAALGGAAAGRAGGTRVLRGRALLVPREPGASRGIPAAAAGLSGVPRHLIGGPRGPRMGMAFAA